MNPEMTAMAGLVLALGARHGFDPDHLVAIDGLTRSSRSRWCGLRGRGLQERLERAGHPAVITAVGAASLAAIAAVWLFSVLRSRSAYREARS